MITRAELAADSAKAFDKSFGALSGLAIGDSLGDAARKPENRAAYGITTDFNKGASWSTDDTEFALLTAKTLIRCKGNLTSEDVVHSWLEDVAVQDEFKRGGASEVDAANNLLKGLRPPLSGKYNAFHMSDGSAMRIGPVGIVCAGDPERAAALAEIDASVSHFRDGIWGAQAVAVAVSLAMVDAEMDEIFTAVMKVIPDESWLYHSMNKAFEIVDRANASVLDAWMPLHDELYTTGSWAMTSEAIPSTLACLRMKNESFREGVILAANFARDADTIGAVAGVILGAKYGASGIPAHWIEKTRYPTGTCLQFTKGMDIKKMAKQLSEFIK
jgi:ADP-ribosylglycohydrolase